MPIKYLGNVSILLFSLYHADNFAFFVQMLELKRTYLLRLNFLVKCPMLNGVLRTAGIDADLWMFITTISRCWSIFSRIKRFPSNHPSSTVIVTKKCNMFSTGNTPKMKVTPPTRTEKELFLLPGPCSHSQS